MSTRKPRRTPEDVCIEYAIAAESVREQNRILRMYRCEVAARASSATYSSGFGGFPYMVDPPQAAESTCLDDLYHAPRGPMGSFLGLLSSLNRCATPAKSATTPDRSAPVAESGLDAKRSVEAVGKRLNRTVSA